MRALIWKALRTLLFRLDAETAHRWTVKMIRWTWRIGGARALRIASGGEAGGQSIGTGGIEIFSMGFRSRVGLAAGFDKDAEIVEALPSLGFGFAEIGTITPRPQPGNDRPRLFRDPSRRSVFNCMGFNGCGAEAAARHLEQAKPRLPRDFRVGVNLGKNKDTPLEDAARDYAAAAAPFMGLADYLVINVSSPNTPGLRSLQALGSLLPILDAVRTEVSGWERRPPILLKLAPELGGDALRNLVIESESNGVDGWVLTNTLGGGLVTDGGVELTGGWSGEVLRGLSRSVLIAVREASRKPIISVGGIMDAEEAAERIRLGADLLQIYSGWIYGGPGFPREISAKLK